MDIDHAVDVRVDNTRVKELRLNGEVVYRGYPYLKDDFLGSSLDLNVWDIVDPQSTGDYSVGSGIFSIVNDDRVHDGASGMPLVGVVSKATFPVGSVVKARVRNPRGRHAMLLGLMAGIPDSAAAHAGTVPGVCWYTREDNNTSVMGSYQDETGATGSLSDTTATWMTSYNVIEIRRPSLDVIEFYRNGVLEGTLTNVMFANDYRVCFVTDSHSAITELNVDWIEAIGPFE